MWYSKDMTKEQFIKDTKFCKRSVEKATEQFNRMIELTINDEEAEIICKSFRNEMKSILDYHSMVAELFSNS